MSGYLHQWSHWVTGHPHIKFLFMCPVIKLILISCRLHPGLLVFPPPDGEVILPTSGRFRRRLLMRNSRDAPRGRPRTVVILLNFVTRLERLCWRQPEYGGDRPPAKSRQLRRCVATAGPLVMGLSMTADSCLRCISRAPPVATSRVVV